jgi:DNA-binding transcriptional regulator YbjK
MGECGVLQGRISVSDITLENQQSSAGKLISAVLVAWEHYGAVDISARNLATAAGLPTSSIHYHFGTLGRLLETAQNEALAAAAHWCEARWAASGPNVASPKMLGPLLAGMIDDWCETQRRLAFAYREGQLIALRDPASAPLAAHWETMWHSYFKRVCAQMGVGDLATLTTWFFDGASALHLLRWRRPLDRAALDELCHGWANWTEGQLAPDAPYYALGRADAERLTAPDTPDAAIDSLARAAAATLADGGVTALTHRAVAARAGMTLGIVSYRYRTSADLLQAAFHTIYHDMVAGSSDAPEPARHDVLAAADNSLPGHNALLGLEELAVAAARREDMQPFAAQLRYLRGRSSGRRLRAIIPQDRPLSDLDRAIYSALLAGRARSYAATGRPHDADRLAADLAPILSRFDTG